MEKFIQLPNGATAFITGCPDDSGCEHQWDGDGLVSFGNSLETYTEKQYWEIHDSMTQEQWEAFHKDKGSVMGEVTCSKCGMPYTTFDNPHYK